ncbi:hypothetical protein EJB10_03145 [Wolbachia endosymbiont of Brugia malayi]|uniref:hypothetical protein n=1 Tax=Wolbachia endosymbiont of Brugia malayi TaxID=80849 RepID=UPI00004C92D1|nr:hypothetical protein [Wolbachia endosymbiont of Brugia malayi]AAW70784.1 Predicted protein [Wolbachia endosymbiont strain TRS of Brugia malayi]QCB61756.1 hypothetical protein EJB10_03145 [Wolbachia endosymbiont of Brugia malayi]
MNIENIQQEFFPLFDKIKKEGDPIYNARVGFNIVKSLIERGTGWNKDEIYEVLQKELNKMERAQQELEKEAERVLSRYIIDDDVKGAVKGVSIYGNHASIKLEDNKKEFKISEFLNSDFCQKNGISGFSTLHRDEKSGMHGFVAEEGEGKDKRKVRHYVVTDGSYEMTLNWYDKEGKKCTIRININANSIKLIGGNITEEQLKDLSKANWDVKIGGLFLHEIEFRKTRENEINMSFETAIKIFGRSIQTTDMNREIGSQNAMTSTTNSHAPTKENPPLPPHRVSSLKKGVEQRKTKSLDHQSNGQKVEFNKYIQSNTLDLHELNSMNVPKLLELLKKEQNTTQINLGWNSIDNKNAEKLFRQRGLVIMANCREEENPGDQGYNLQSLFEVPTPSPLRTSSLKKNVSDEQGENISFKPISQSQDNRQKDERYDNLTFVMFRYTTSGRKKTVTEEDLQVKSAVFALPTQDVTLKKVEGTFKSEDAKKSDNMRDKQTSQDGVASILARRAEIEFLYSESERGDGLSDPEDDRSGNKDEYLTLLNPQSDDKNAKRGEKYENCDCNDNLEHIYENTDWLCDDKQDNRQRDKRYDNHTFAMFVYTLPGSKRPDDLHRNEQKLDNQQQPEIQQQGQSHSRPQSDSKGNLDVKGIQPSALSEDGDRPISTSTDKRNTKQLEYGKNSKDHNSETCMVPSKPAGKESKSIQFTNPSNQMVGKLEKVLKKLDRESEKTVQQVAEGSVSINKPLSSVSTDGNMDAEQNSHTQSEETNLSTPEKTNVNSSTSFKELEQRLSQKNYELKKISSKVRYISPQTKEYLMEAELLKDSSTDIRKAIERKNAHTSPTTDKNSELYKLLEKDKTQLKVRVIEKVVEGASAKHTDNYDRNRITLGNKNRKLLWTKHVKQQQEKGKGISI